MAGFFNRFFSFREMPRVTPFGGADEIGGSCYLIEYQHRRTLIDCGMRFKKHGDVQFSLPPRGGIPNGVDSVFLTHAHWDHSGALPVAEARGRFNDKATIYATRPTIFQSMLLWEDGVKVAKYQKRDHGIKLLYGLDNVARVLERVRVLNGIGWLKPYPDSDMEVLPWPAGHIPGAASFFVRFGALGPVIMFSGDMCAEDQAEVRGAPLAPEELHGKVDMVFMESTNCHNLPPREAEDQRMFDDSIEVLRRGGDVLIPSFASRAVSNAVSFARRGVTREVVGGEGKITGGSPLIVMEGLAAKFMRAFMNPKKNNWLQPWDVDRSEIICREAGKDGSIPEGGHILFSNSAARRDLLRIPSGLVFIVTSGGMSFGMSSIYAPMIVEDPKNAILIGGHVFEGSKAADILGAVEEMESNNEISDNLSLDDLVSPPLDVLDPGMSVRFGNYVCKVECDVRRYCISSHNSANDTLDYLKALGPKRVKWVHGDKKSQEVLTGRMKKEIPHINASSSKTGETIEL